MSLTTTTSRAEYNGNGTQTVFAYPFRIFDQTDLQVYVGGALQTLTTHYSVSGADLAAGGNVTFVTAPPTGTANVVLVRVVPMTQTLTYPNNGKFPASATEEALDRVTVLAQQLSELSGRNLTLPVTSTFEGLTLPDPVAGQFMRWKANLTGFENTTIGAGAISTPVAIALGGTASTTASAARTALGAGTWADGGSVVAAATLPVTSSGNYFTVTGSTGITGLASGLVVGTLVHLRFTGTPLLTHHATNLVLVGGVNYTVAVGDVLTFVCKASGQWEEIARQTNNGASSSKFWAGNGTWATPSTPLTQYVRKLHLRTSPDRDSTVQHQKVTLLSCADVVLHDGTRVEGLLNLSADITVSGANGLDTGSETASTWYEIYVIRKSSDATLGLCLHKAPFYQVDVSQTTYATQHQRLRDSGSSNYTHLAQSFTATTSAPLHYVDLYFRRVGSPGGTKHTVTLCADSSGAPNDASPLATADLWATPDVLATGIGFYRYYFSVPATMTSSTTYWIVVTNDCASSGSAWQEWGQNSVDTAYTGGTAKAKAAGAWGASLGVDFVFKMASLQLGTAFSSTIPAGYDQYAKLGFVYNNASSNFLEFVQTDREARYIRPEGIVGNAVTGGTATQWTLMDLTAFVPAAVRSATFRIAVGSGLGADGTVSVNNTVTTTLFEGLRHSVESGSQASMIANLPVNASHAYYTWGTAATGRSVSIGVQGWEV